ncbi:hypothetical protein LX73_0731 [Fodinibius salinus]|uniref:Restriction endonuclease n=1 Tax=Fodinibius salinus TaxID=860790 RepID=A0A5D3YQ78_9BACT|nr:hypothetical protein [Fodinibius salinus]TYP95428.1 hypothetical protein LX73_0731 [Fodinibius salinus]
MIQVQESFLSNKFIPLEKRKNIVEEVDSIRSSIYPTLSSGIDDSLSSIVASYGKKTESENDLIATIIDILSIITALTALIVGLYSIFSKAKAEQEAEVEEKVESKKDEIEEGFRRAFDFENLVGNILKNVTDFEITRTNPREYLTDFEINSPKGKIGVEVKYSVQDRLMGNVVHQIKHYSSQYDLGIIVVSNVPFSNYSRKLFESEGILLVTSENEDEIKEKIKESINRIMNKNEV